MPFDLFCSVINSEIPSRFCFLQINSRRKKERTKNLKHNNFHLNYVHFRCRYIYVVLSYLLRTCAFVCVYLRPYDWHVYFLSSFFFYSLPLCYTLQLISSVSVYFTVSETHNIFVLNRQEYVICVTYLRFSNRLLFFSEFYSRQKASKNNETVKIVTVKI